MNFIIQFIVGLIFSVGGNLLQQAFAPKQQEQQQRGQTGMRGTAQTGGKVSQYFLVGTVADAGKLEYRNTWGQVGEVPNAYFVEVYSFGDLPISGLEGLYINGEPVTLTGPAVAQGSAVVEYHDGSDHIWADFADGASNVVASTYLTDKFGADPERPWTSDMVGIGVPYITMTSLWAESLFTGFPSILPELHGIKLYDPRLDSTVGGAGSQRWDNPATWAFSDNSMVIIYNIERGISYAGAHVWGGKKSAAQMPYSVWAAAMDACDEAVTLAGGGSEKRFRAGRRIGLNERPADVIQEFLIGCNGRRAEAADGTVYVLVGVPDEADGAFTDADVLATNALGTVPFPNLDEVINGATATYREPAQAWEDKETAPYLRSDLEAEDDGRQQLQGLDLGTTFSGYQAQRVLKAVIEEGRRFRKHVVALPPEYAQFRLLQVLAWTSARFDYTAKLFLITARTVEPFGNVILGLQEIDPADHAWDPDEDERPLSFAPVVTNRPAPQEVSGFSVAPAIALDSAGNSRRPAIDVFWASTSVTVDVRAVRITIRLADTDVIVWEGEAPRPELGEARITQALLPAEDYEVQIQYMPFSGRVTVESSWLSVTTPNVRLGPLDIEGLFDLIAAEISEDLKWLSVNARNAIENFERLGSLLAEQDLANFNDRETLRRELRKKTGDLEASFTEIIEVALGPGGAIAQSLSSLYASMGGNSAEVLVRWGAESTPVGVTARWGLQLSTDGDAFGTAAFLVQVKDGASEIILDADRTIISTSGGQDIIALFNSDGAFVGNLTAGRIESLDGNSYWDLDSGDFRIST